MKASERLIVALDVPEPDDARNLISKIGDHAGVWKIGLELLFSGGADLACELADAGQKVFVDAKLLDIPNTVERATENIAAMGATFLTVHGHDVKTMKAAMRGREGSNLKLLSVTVLTSLDAADLEEQGSRMSPAELVLHRAKLRQEAGFDGVIASGQEAAQIREATGSDFLIITPGIRPSGTDVGDQARVMTPARAIAAGADYLVVGRPITQADDPAAAAAAIAGEIESARSA
ncbi:MAG: orotidine-5'-phosphate decarboxylase [Hyphomicrobiaceae bacterium]|nr:orotidine-5'-phosphate decarboxylase [Hyphomicrobiaceae bacterium]